MTAAKTPGKLLRVLGAGFGIAVIVGAVIGVGIIDLLSFFLSERWETGWPIVLGLLLLAVILFRPTGLMGLFVSERERVGSFGKRETGSADKSDSGTTEASTS